MKMNKKTLVWVGLGLAALYLYNRNQAAGGGLFPTNGGGGFGTGSPTGTPEITPGVFDGSPAG